jgi:heterodisulfide reductase subunit B
MRSLQVGRDEPLLRSSTFWLCASCQACTARCPQGIDVARVMDALRITATRRGAPAKVPEALIFSQAAMRTVRWFGRIYEVGVGVEVNLRTRQPLRQAAFAVRMLRAGRLRLVPDRPGRASGRPAVAGEIGYYPGCALHAGAGEYDSSTRAVAAALGLRLREIEGWRCCGASAAHQTSSALAVDLPLANLALAARNGTATVTAPCAACFSRLRAAQSEAADRAPEGMRVQHLLHTLLEAGTEAIRARATRPLGGLRVACYYGCLLTRPPAVTGAPNPEYPMEMDRLVEALGAQPVEWSYKTECCGAGHTVVRPDLVVRLVGRLLRNAQAAGAEALVVACPLCHHNLEARQEEAAAAAGLPPTPVLYFTQLMALAFGLPEQYAGLDRMLVDPRPLLRLRGLLPEGRRPGRRREQTPERAAMRR